MSHIDSYDHEYLGSFGYLPIYRALKPFGEDSPWGDYDFGANPDNLILGGGSGEHPGLVVHELAACVACFLVDQLDEDYDEHMDPDDLSLLHDLSSTPHDEILEFCEWGLGRYADFMEMIKSNRMRTPFDPDRDDQTEEWLIRNMGEFVYYALPELNPYHDRMKAMVANTDIHAKYENIVCPPPGYPSRGGRIMIDGELKWGYHRWFS